jgi:hypothetical protein
MSSSVVVQKFLSRNKMDLFAHDPADSTVATEIGWVDMRDYDGIVLVALNTALTGNGVVTFKAFASENSDGSGTPTLIKSAADPTDADAEGDYLVLEVSAAEIAQAAAEESKALRYVSAELDMQNAADEAAVVYVRFGARHAQGDLTARNITE